MKKFLRIIKDTLYLVLVFGLPLFMLLIGIVVLNVLKKQTKDINNMIVEISSSESINEKVDKISLLSSGTIKDNDDLIKIKNKILSDNKSLSKKIEEKNDVLASLEEEKEKVKKINLELKSEYKKTQSHYIKNVMTINQYPDYPTGCELVALTILLNYYGINASVDDVIDVLPIGEVPHYEDGIIFGGNPNYEFLGDPRSSHGWGIWDKGLINVANKFKSNAINGTGKEFKEITKLIYNDRPVIVWVTINLQDSYVFISWNDKNTNEKIEWKIYNHAVVVVGYDENSIIISDPIDGKIKYLDKEKFIRIYNYMGKKTIYY